MGHDDASDGEIARQDERSLLSRMIYETNCWLATIPALFREAQDQTCIMQLIRNLLDIGTGGQLRWR